MKFLFDMTNIRILHTSMFTEELLFDEGTLPPSCMNVWSFRIEGMDDPLFLGSPQAWTELNLRRLYTWMQIKPPLTPTKMDDAAILDLRTRLRAEMVRGLGLEPSKLPTLVPPTVVIIEPTAPRPPRLPNATRGSVGPLIHRIATEMWEAAGKPSDIPTILALRQTIMKVLNSEHDIKMSTSSNELGRWQKQLVSTG